MVTVSLDRTVPVTIEENGTVIAGKHNHGIFSQTILLKCQNYLFHTPVKFHNCIAPKTNAG